MRDELHGMQQDGAAHRDRLMKNSMHDWNSLFTYKFDVTHSIANNCSLPVMLFYSLIDSEMGLSLFLSTSLENTNSSLSFPLAV